MIFHLCTGDVCSSCFTFEARGYKCPSLSSFVCFLPSFMSGICIDTGSYMYRFTRLL